jgi:S-adenosylhomocysteine hydrolase
MDAAELEWIAWTTPITTSLGAALAASDFSGRTVACRQHILAATICIVAPFVEAGARVRLAPCNPDSTDDRTVAHLASIGVEVRARAGMSAGELDESLAWLVSEPADAVCDMGGDLIAAAAAAGHRPAGALEATTTGLHRLDGLEIPFPVLDWNGIALKDLIHNRHHVRAWRGRSPPAPSDRDSGPPGDGAPYVGFGRLDNSTGSHMTEHQSHGGGGLDPDRTLLSAEGCRFGGCRSWWR